MTKQAILYHGNVMKIVSYLIVKVKTAGFEALKM
jgi:hypothetical protein